MELNPNHPATIEARDQWHKIAALLMRKMGTGRVVISRQEIEEFAVSGGANITIRFDDVIGIELRIVDDRVAAMLVKKAGGLPV